MLRFIYNLCSGSTKKPITFGSILSVEKVVMNENVKFNSFQFQKIRLCFKNSNVCVISESHSILSLSVSLTWWNLDFSSKPRKISKMFNLFWRPRYSKLQTNCLIRILVQTVFFLHAKFKIWYDHWESLKIGLAPLYRSYCIS